VKIDLPVLMILIQNHYSPRFLWRRRTSERTATTGPFGKSSDSVSVINLAVRGRAQMLAGEHYMSSRRTELKLSWYNFRMSKTVTTLDQHSSVPLPPEALDALGIEAGAELEVEIVGVRWWFAQSRKHGVLPNS
jgi:hypothetical protein